MLISVCTCKNCPVVHIQQGDSLISNFDLKSEPYNKGVNCPRQSLF